MPARRLSRGSSPAVSFAKLWFAPTLFWLSSSSHALMLVTWIGLVASIVAFVNLWPRLSFFVCFVCFLSFVSAASEFSNYQSDGMLLEAGFIALFFAPRGLLPGLGACTPPSRASLFLLQWEWFRIYFESGMVKLVSGDRQWRTLTAMDEYYQNGPLPTWIGWYVEHLPHWFQAASAAGTLVLELALVWMMFFPRRVRIVCFFIVTPWEIGVILTANYTFLNYLVLSLGFLLLDDKFLLRLVPARYRSAMASASRSTNSERKSRIKLAPPTMEQKQRTIAARRGRVPRTAQWPFQRDSARHRRGDAHMDFLRHDRGDDRDSLPHSAAAHYADCGARALSHRQPVRPVCGDDQRALRDRIPGLERRRELDRVSIPQQAAGAERGAAHLRALSAALRLEPVVCVARRLAPG